MKTVESARSNGQLDFFTSTDGFDGIKDVKQSYEDFKAERLANVLNDFDNIDVDGLGFLSNYLCEEYNYPNMYDDMDLLKKVADKYPYDILDYLSDKLCDGLNICTPVTARLISEYVVEKYYDKDPYIYNAIITLPSQNLSGEFYKNFIPGHRKLFGEIVKENTSDYWTACLAAASCGIYTAKLSLYRAMNIDGDANVKALIYDIASSDVDFARSVINCSSESFQFIKWDKTFDIAATQDIYNFFEEVVGDSAKNLKVALKYFPDDSNLSHLSVRAHGLALKNCTFQTKELVEEAVNNEPKAIKYANRKLLGDEYLNTCIACVSEYPVIISDLESKLSEKEIISVIEKVPEAITHLNTITKNMVLAVKDNDKIFKQIAYTPISDMNKKSVIDLVKENRPDLDKIKSNTPKVTAQDLSEEKNRKIIDTFFI